MNLHVYLQLHMHTRIYPYTHIIDDFMWHPCRPSKVSCRDIRQARVTRNPSKGLKKLTKVSLRKSEVGSHKVFRDHGASLDVKDFKGWPCQQIWIPVREVWRLAEIPRWIWPPPVLGWNQWLGSHEEWPEPFLVPVSEMNMFDANEPGAPQNHGMTIPVVVHGDEGRGRKKTSWWSFLCGSFRRRL